MDDQQQQPATHADLGEASGVAGAGFEQHLVEPSYAVLNERVAAAQEALLACARSAPDHWWDPKILREQAQNGPGGDVMMFALTDLVNRGVLELDPQLRVKVRVAS